MPRLTDMFTSAKLSLASGLLSPTGASLGAGRPTDSRGN